MTRPKSLIFSSFLVIALQTVAAATAFAADSESKMNILVLYADDWRHDTLGVAGNPVVKTPHLDQLANSGMRFTQNCVTTSICGISRATLFTGQWMSRHGNRSFKPWNTPWAETYPGLLRDNGYHVGHVGNGTMAAFRRISSTSAVRTTAPIGSKRKTDQRSTSLRRTKTMRWSF